MPGPVSSSFLSVKLAAVSIILQAPTAELMIAFPATNSNDAAWLFLHLCEGNMTLIVIEHLPSQAWPATRVGVGWGGEYAVCLILSTQDQNEDLDEALWVWKGENFLQAGGGGITGFLHFSHFYRK